ncbi:MAG: DUF2794 domain-containing protein [Hyphomicrobiaceae bacterium]
MSDSEPIVFRPRHGASLQGASASLSSPPASARREPSVITFDRSELADILAVYGRKVAAGEWRDYALDFGREKAVFSAFRRSSEWPLFRIEKNPRYARKQGAYSVIAATGLILKRGHELKRVLEVFEKRSLYVVEG